ncbi:MAG TPA: hypothetical protein VGL66_03030 [Caulobacteraceae bacterium]|jgi:hypothetical protein
MKRTAALFLAGLTIVSLAGCDSFNKGFRKGFFRSEMDAWANRGMAGGAFAEMRTDFPADYEAMKDRLADKYAAGASDAEETQEALIELKSFIAGKSDDVAKAPQDALLPINAQRTRIFDAVRAESVDACAQMAQGGMTGATKLSQATQDILAHIVALDIHAAKAGMDHPTTYPDFSFTNAERSALIAQLDAQGLHAAAAGGGDASAQCGVATVTQHFIAALPPDRIAAFESAAAVQTRKILSGG